MPFAPLSSSLFLPHLIPDWCCMISYYDSFPWMMTMIIYCFWMWRMIDVGNDSTGPRLSVLNGGTSVYNIIYTQLVLLISSASSVLKGFWECSVCWRKRYTLLYKAQQSWHGERGKRSACIRYGSSPLRESRKIWGRIKDNAKAHHHHNFLHRVCVGKKKAEELREREDQW